MSEVKVHYYWDDEKEITEHYVLKSDYDAKVRELTERNEDLDIRLKNASARADTLKAQNENLERDNKSWEQSTNDINEQLSNLEIKTEKLAKMCDCKCKYSESKGAYHLGRKIWFYGERLEVCLPCEILKRESRQGVPK